MALQKLIADHDWNLDQLDYENDNRDSDGFQVGVNVNNGFTEKVTGDFRAGYELKNFNGVSEDEADSPYFSADVINAGAIELTTSGPYQDRGAATLVVDAGTLINQDKGIIDVTK